MNTLFIADLHLTETRPDMTAAFLQFMAGPARQADALYILGDLFEVWVGDDEQLPLHHQVSDAIRQLVKSQVPVYFIHGNRDFLLGRRFAREAAMTLLPEHHCIDLYGQKALIMHGDSLCTLDEEYQAFRKKSRSRWWQWMILSLPLFVRRRIGRNYRAKSQLHNQYKSSEIMDVTPAEVQKVMVENGVDLLIHGHTHRPAIHNFTLNDQPATRIVLGDWFEQSSILVVSADGWQLRNSPLPADQSALKLDD